MKWQQMLDLTLQLSLIIIVFIWLYTSGAVFEVEYYNKLVSLYTYPWWRWLLLVLLIVASSWSPTLAMGLLMALFFYFADIGIII